MKFFFAFVLITAAWAADEPKTGKARTPAKAEKSGTASRSAPAQKAAAPAPAAQELKVPAGAVPAGAGTWNYTDPQGKKWIYRQTPFGLSRVEDKAPDPEEALKQSEGISVVSVGPVVQFERPGPFGMYRWQRKADELNEAEKAAVERFRSAASAARQE